MKRLKRIASIVLAMAMVLGMSLTAFAEPGDSGQSGGASGGYPITIEGKTKDHTYGAYQIFAGDLKIDPCTKEVHEHVEDCYDDEKKLTCKIEEHKHTEGCTVKTLSNITWGSGIDTEKLVDNKNLMQALAEAKIGKSDTDIIEANMTAREVAETLTGCDAENTQKFSDVVGKYLKGNPATSTLISDTTNYQITVSEVGYYFITRTSGRNQK